MQRRVWRSFQELDTINAGTKRGYGVLRLIGPSATTNRDSSSGVAISKCAGTAANSWCGSSFANVRRLESNTSQALRAPSRGHPGKLGKVHMHNFTVLTAVTMMVVSSATFAHESGEREMDSGALRKAVAGKTVHLATALGSLPINYRTDGTMFGRAGFLASYTGSDRDRGRWWIVGDKLCQRWNTWLGGKSYCFWLRQLGATVHWTRDDGLSGLAAIARRR